MEPIYSDDFLPTIFEGSDMLNFEVKASPSIGRWICYVIMLIHANIRQPVLSLSDNHFPIIKVQNVEIRSLILRLAFNID